MFSALNALLLSKYSRRLVLKHMKSFITKLPKDKRNVFLRGDENNVTSKKWYFFRYARTFWKEQRQLNNTNQNVYRRITHNTRPVGCKFTRGTTALVSEQARILSSIGITDKEVMILQKNPPVRGSTRAGGLGLVATHNAFDPYNIASNYDGLKLNSAILYVFNSENKHGHVITGIIAPDGTKKVIDSMGHIIEVDWTTREGLEKTKNFYRNKNHDEIYISSIMYINETKLPVFSI